MPHHHTVLSEILKHVPHARFKELIKSYDADGGSRRLDKASLWPCCTVNCRGRRAFGRS